jgi:protein TonB
MAVAADSSFISRRSLVLILIVALHVGFFWALNSGLSKSVVDVVFGPIETRVIEEQKQEEKAPPPPPPKMETPPPYVPPPEVAIDLPVESNTTAITQVTTQRPVAPPPPPAPVEHKEVKVQPRVDQRRLPPTEDYYPPQSQRSGEEGVVTVAFYVNEEGKITDVKIQQSSGIQRLDEAAIKYVKAWPKSAVSAGTVDGKPAAMWLAMNVRFKLKG